MSYLFIWFAIGHQDEDLSSIWSDSRKNLSPDDIQSIVNISGASNVRDGRNSIDDIINIVESAQIENQASLKTERDNAESDVITNSGQTTDGISQKS